MKKPEVGDIFYHNVVKNTFEILYIGNKLCFIRWEEDGKEDLAPMWFFKENRTRFVHNPSNVQ